ncbi:MAG: triose-phosphate isomerase [Eubacteriales bacterium]|nr:triose-phosphate isomerase [Eubacteriales bacterium]MDD4583136.1 triose-phosphate isomerase [Eubacteriales bacterium]
MRKPFLAGNWKMYKTSKEAADFAVELKKLYVHSSNVNVAICAPFTQLSILVDAFKGSGIKVGAQNMHYEEKGAFTGEISANMLTEIGVDYCIIGHSERRQYFGETDETVNKKLHKTFAHNILPILCVGEVLEERDAGKATSVVKKQITAALDSLSVSEVKKLTVAYEPVWAIGTGRTATPEQADEMCGHIRSVIKGLYDKETADHINILYGGSVKPNNVTELMNMDEIDGALVGGASLNAADFIKIINF